MYRSCHQIIQEKHFWTQLEFAGRLEYERKESACELSAGRGRKPTLSAFGVPG